MHYKDSNLSKLDKLKQLQKEREKSWKEIRIKRGLLSSLYNDYGVSIEAKDPLQLSNFAIDQKLKYAG